MNKAVIIPLALMLLSACSGSQDSVTVSPDYRGVTVPCNIAPLNFHYEEARGRTVLSAPGVKFSTLSRKVRIPSGKWTALIEAAKGSSIKVSGPAGEWDIFVSGDTVDEYLTYRLIEPGYEVWDRVEIRERKVSDFSERTLCDWNHTDNSCMNCHMHKGGNSMFYIRGRKGGAVLNRGGQLRYVTLKTEGMLSGTVYGDLHPSGRWGVFSTNKIIPSFHSRAEKRMEVFDTFSDLTVADFDENAMINDPAFARKDKLETFPCFSADGTQVFYCVADTVSNPLQVEKLHYDLVCTSFDPSTGRMGHDVRVVWSAAEHGGSACHPKASPDGRWLMFTVADFGTFPLWHRECHLELLDLRTGETRSLECIHGNASDSYHCWSTDSHWFVFASKRGDGQYGKPYFCRIDDDGTPTIPFVLPQEDPCFYDKTLKSFNVPDLGTFSAPYDAERTGMIRERTDAEAFSESPLSK